MATGRLKSKINDIVNVYNKMTDKGKTGIFIHLAEKYGVTPVCIARLVVEFFENKNAGLKKESFNCKNLLWDSTLIDDGALAYEVHVASLFDNSYSQIANIVTTLNGREHEKYLQACLSSQGLSFKTEEELRKLNFTKTPDILMEIPFALGNSVIKWIESKACFGDDELHEKYVKQQYQHYYKFGPGLVIYWYGFLESIKYMGNSKNLLICDHFPANIVKIS